MVYKKQNGALTLESAGFEGGRFVAFTTSSGTTYQPHYFITDHLGSVRVVVDGNGTVQERNDYYPYGMRWNEGQISATNRYRYNGKEWQGFLNVPYNDHGARMVDSRFRLSWGGVDPLAEDTPEVSPFAFCGNNPIWNFGTCEPANLDKPHLPFHPFCSKGLYSFCHLVLKSKISTSMRVAIAG